MPLSFNEAGSAANAVSIVHEIDKKFPELTTVYGYRPPGDGYDEHSTGLAEDFMTYTNKVLQYKIADYITTNADRFGLQWVIRDQQIWSLERRSEGWRPMADRGGLTANHKDHVHMFIKAGTYVPPEGEPIMSSGDVWVGLLTAGRTNSDSVSRMQSQLNATSFPPHRNIPVTGNYDGATDQCVRDFQKFIGDAVDAPGRSSIGPRQAARLFAGSGYNVRQGVPPTAAPAPKPAAPAPKPATVSTPFNGGRVTYGYGARNAAYAAGFHTGDDWACSTGTPIRTMWTGKVVGAGNVWGSAYGNQVVVEFTPAGQPTRRMLFAHLSRIDVHVGQAVSSGQQIGLSGATGNVTGPHLHLEQRTAPYGYNNHAVKPVY